MDFSNHKFRCSELAHLVSVKNPTELTEGNKTYLSNVYLSKKYGRKNILSTKEIEKGNLTEQDSLELIQEYFGTKFFKKNDKSFENDFICGTPDITKILIDAKSSWSIHTFHFAQITDVYYWQMQGYMDLLNVDTGYLCYCLNNTPAHLIEDEKRKQAYIYKCIDIETDEYVEVCKQIEINSIFDIKPFLKENPHFSFHNNLSEWSYDIERKARIKVFEIKKDEAKIEMLKRKIIKCREYLNTLNL